MSDSAPRKQFVRVLNAPSFTIEAPSNAGKYGRNYGDPNSSSGEPFVCDVHGTVDEGDCYIDSIYVLNLDVPFPTYPDPAPVNSSNQVIPPEVWLGDYIMGHANKVVCSNIDKPNNMWKIDSQSSQKVQGFLGENGADRTNYMAAVAVFGETSNPDCAPRQYILAQTSWTAEKDPDCANSRLKKAVQTAANGTDCGCCCGSEETCRSELVPIEVADGWMHYLFVLRNRRPFVAQLFMPGGIDRMFANEIEVAATHVNWRPSPNRPLVIRDPQGLRDCGPKDTVAGREHMMNFPGLPKFSLVLQQSGVDHRTVVTSQCRDNPQQVSLSPIRSVIVTVNDNNTSMGDNEGVIDLWVRIVG